MRKDSRIIFLKYPTKVGFLILIFSCSLTRAPSLFTFFAERRKG